MGMFLSPNTRNNFIFHRFRSFHLTALPTLAMNRLLGFTGAAMLALFFPIFLFELFNGSVIMVLMWYLVMNIIRMPVIVLAAKVFSKTGLVTSMVVGTFGAAAFYLFIFLIDFGFLNSTALLLFLAMLSLSIRTAFYWSPFHVDFAKFTKKGRRGRQVSLVLVAERFIALAAPVLAGFILTQYSYGVVFLFGFVLVLLSLIPLFYIPRTKVTYEFGFFETFKKMFEKSFRNMSLSMVARGAENSVGILIWPIFLFIVFKGAYLDVGVFATVVVFLGIAIQLLIGKMIDKGPAKRILRIGTNMYSIGWFFKSLVSSLVGVFAASLFHTLGSILMGTPFEAIYYEKAADAGHYIDEYTVIREAALNIGRILMIILLLVILSWFSLSVSFVLAAVVSLGASTIAKTKAV